MMISIFAVEEAVTFAVTRNSGASRFCVGERNSSGTNLAFE